MTQKAIQPDDLFNISSISKSDISAIILKLQKEGILSLDDTFDRWLSEIMSQITDGEKASDPAPTEGARERASLTISEFLIGLKQFSHLE